MLAIRSLAGAKQSSCVKKIICIDDNDFVLEILDLYLESRGFAVVPCSSGIRALELLDVETPDAITLDFELPDMDGAQIAAAIRVKNPRIPIVMFSGSTDICRSTLDLVDSFVSKGAVNGFAVLADALDSVLSRKKSHRAPANTTRDEKALG